MEKAHLHLFYFGTAIGFSKKETLFRDLKLQTLLVDALFVIVNTKRKF